MYYQQLEPLERFCANNYLPLDDTKAAQYAMYLEMLLTFNRAMNLIGPMDVERVIDELFIDSLMPAVATSFECSTLDVGTGAGLPGLVLAIMHPTMELTLVEPRKKRSTFMRIAFQRLNLQDRVTLHQERIEHVPGTTHERVISKAFAPPVQWLEIASKWIAPQTGQVICMTRAQERPALEVKADELGLELVAQASHQQEPEEGMARMTYVFGQKDSSS